MKNRLLRRVVLVVLVLAVSAVPAIAVARTITPPTPKPTQQPVPVVTLCGQRECVVQDGHRYLLDGNQDQDWTQALLDAEEASGIDILLLPAYTGTDFVDPKVLNVDYAGLISLWVSEKATTEFWDYFTLPQKFTPPWNQDICETDVCYQG